ncbi:MAG: terpene cyclase/mutase family protein [Myxococcota bacterium]|nr:terpene cyclase/mutase family protein [Myxococcota bacterium]
MLTPSTTSATSSDSIASIGERTRAAIDGAVANLRARQEPDGHWAGDYGGPLFLLPGLVIACEITGTDLGEEKRGRMRAYLRHTQNDDGGWGLHVEDSSSVFGTGLNYVAMRLLGIDADDPDARRARERLLALGGAEEIPTWGKLWLAVLGVYRWEGVAPLSPELYLLPRSAPMHPSRFWCHTRQVFLPMSYLYGRRAQGPETDLVRALRGEMFRAPWSSIDWPSLRTRIAPGDAYTPQSPVLRAAYRALGRYEQRPSRRLRARALAHVIEHVHHEDETTGYLTIGPVSKSIQMLAVYFEDPSSDAFRKHVARIDDYLWDAPEGLKMQGYNGSQLWDTAFAAQAMLESELPQREGAFLDVLGRAHAWIDDNQIREDVPDADRYYRDRVRGTWPFSTREQGWSVSDCTAEAIKVAVQMEPLAERPIPEARLREAIDALLESQNPDGGWSEYERTRGSRGLELLNASEVFGEVMIGYSYVECTSACIQSMLTFGRVHPGHREHDVRRAIERGLDFVRARQRDDGSWYGGWGICFTYGTWFGIDVLAQCGRSEDVPRIERACRFLIGRQRDDGAWSESHRSCVEKRWVPHEDALPVQTAWALLGLLGAHGVPDPDGRRRRAIERGIEHLLTRQNADGTWEQHAISGAFNRNCMIHYDNYRHVMPLWALGRYHRLTRT